MKDLYLINKKIKNKLYRLKYMINFNKKRCITLESLSLKYRISVNNGIVIQLFIYRKENNFQIKTQKIGRNLKFNLDYQKQGALLHN